MAEGCSTNAIIHLVAISRRAGCEVTLDDFDAMNEVWDDWVAPGDAPPRATVEARLARAKWKIEIVVTAAISSGA